MSQLERVGSVLLVRRLGALVLRENSLGYLKKKKFEKQKKEKTRSSAGKYCCFAALSLALGPDRLGLISGFLALEP